MNTKNFFFILITVVLLFTCIPITFADITNATIEMDNEFNGFPRSGIAPLEVTFELNSTGDEKWRWDWDFDTDGLIDDSYAIQNGSRARAGDICYPTQTTSDGTYIYVTDYQTHRISKYFADNLTFVDYFGEFGTGDDQFNGADGVTTDGTYLYTMDYENHRVVKRFASNYTYVNKIGSYGTGNNQFKYPWTISNDGTYIYITDCNNHRIVKRFASNLTYVSKVGSYGTGNDQFEFPTGVSTDGTYLYVADSGNNRIVKRFASNLTYVSKIGSYGTGNDQFNEPNGVATDGVYIYVADSGNNRIVKRFASNLTYISHIGEIVPSDRMSDIQVYNPSCVDIYGSYLYVCDAGNKRIVKYDKNTLTYIAETPGGTEKYTDFTLLRGGSLVNDEYLYVTLDGQVAVKLFLSNLSEVDRDFFDIEHRSGSFAADDEYYYVPDYLNNTLYKIRMSDNIVVSENSSYAVRWVYQIYCDDDYIYLPEGSGHEVYKISKNDLILVDSISEYYSGIPFEWVAAVCTDDTYLYISDYAATAVITKFFKDNLTFVTNMSYSYSLLTGPEYLCTDGEYLYVADGRYKIHKVRCSDLSYVSNTSTSQGIYEDNLQNPESVQISNNVLYIGDQLNNRIIKYNASTMSLLDQPTSTHTYTIPGLYDVKLWLSGLESALSYRTKEDYINVTPDLFTGSPQSGSVPLPVTFELNSTGDEKWRWNWDFDNDGVIDDSYAIQNGSQSREGDYAYPCRVTTDGVYVYTTDYVNDRIEKSYFDNLTYVDQFGIYGTGDDQTRNIIGIDNDSTYLYVVDSVNARIVKRFASNLTYVSQLGSYGTGNDQFKNPSGVVTDGIYIWVADEYNHRIVKRFASNLTYISKIGSYGTGDDQFKYPDGIATDGTYLYIGDSGNHRIVKRFASNLTYVSKNGTYGSGDYQFRYPRGISTDGTYIWIADVYNNRIVKRFASNLTYASQFEGDLFDPLDTEIYGNYLLVVDSQNQRVVKYTKDTFTYIDETHGGYNTFSRLETPYGNVIVNDEYLYVTNYEKEVVKYFLSNLSEIGRETFGYSYLFAAMTADDEFYYIPDYNSYNLHKIRMSDGVVVASNSTFDIDWCYQIYSDDDYIYAGGDYGGKLYKISKDDLILEGSISESSPGTTFIWIGGVCVDDNYLYVGDSPIISKYFKNNLTYITHKKRSGTYPLNGIVSCYSDGEYVYVADGDYIVHKLNCSDLSYVSNTSTSRGIYENNLACPSGVYISNGVLCIIDSFNNRIIKYNASTMTLLESPKSTHTYTIPGLYDVTLWLSGLESVLTYETKEDYIDAYNLNASFISNTTSGITPLIVQFTDLTDNGTPTNWLWNIGGTILSSQHPLFMFTHPGSYTVELNSSNSYTWDNEIKTDYISVTGDITNATSGMDAEFTGTPRSGYAQLPVTFELNSTGEPWRWDWDFENDGNIDDSFAIQTGSRSRDYDFNLVWGVAADESYIYALDLNNFRISSFFESNLTYVSKIGSYGTGNDQFSVPRSITTDGTYIYVADSDNHRIVKRFASNLTYVSKIGSYGTGNDQFKYPSGVNENGTYIYVSDSGNHRIVKRFASNLTYVSKIGSYGTGNDQFNYPYGIATDGTYLYIADSGNHRIVKRFASNLTYVSKIGSSGDGIDQFNYPYGIATDGTYIYVSDSGNHRIVKRFASNLTYISHFGNSTSDFIGDNELSSPIAVDISGNYLYVADSDNCRIVKYDKITLAYVGETVGGRNVHEGGVYKWAQGNKIQNGYLYTVTSDQQIAKLVLSNLSEVGRESFNFSYKFSSFAIDDDFYYLSDYRSYILYKIRISDGSVVASNATHNIDWCYQMDSDDDYIYAPGNYGSELYKISKNDLTLVDSISERYPGESFSWIGGIYVDDTYLYVGDYGPITFSKYFKNNLTYVTHKTSFDGVTLYSIDSIHSDGEYMYLSNGNVNIHKIRSSDLSYVSNISGNTGIYENDFDAVEHAVPDNGTLYISDYYNNRFIKYNSSTMALVEPPTSTHTYDLPGLYDVKLWLSGLESALSYRTKEDYINVTLSPLSVDFVASNTNPSVGETVYFYKNITAGHFFNESWDFDGNAIQDFQSNSIVGFSRTNYTLYYPRGVAVDDDYVYVSDYYNPRITKTARSDLDYRVYESNHTYGSGNNQMSTVAGICDDSDYIYLTDPGYARIMKLYKENLTYVTRIGGTAVGTGNDQFNTPLDICVDSTSTYVYVADAMNYRVSKRFASNFTYVNKSGAYGTGPGQFRNMYGICIDPTDTYIYIADPTNDRITKMYAENLTHVSNSSGTITYTGMYDVICDGTYLYISDLDNDYIYKRFASNYTLAASPNNVYAYNVYQIDFSPDKSLIFGVRFYNRNLIEVNISTMTVNRSGTNYNQFSTNTSPGWMEMLYNNRVVPDKNYQYVYMSDYGDDRLIVYNYENLSFNSIYSGGRFTDVLGIDIDSSNTYIYLTNLSEGISKLYRENMTVVASILSSGTGTGQYNNPYGIAVDPLREYVYIADAGNHRLVKCFENNLTYVNHVGGTSSGGGVDQFYTPYGVATDGTFVYVVDATNQRIHKRYCDNLSLHTLMVMYGTTPRSLLWNDDGTLLMGDANYNGVYKIFPNNLSWVQVMGNVSESVYSNIFNCSYAYVAGSYYNESDDYYVVSSYRTNSIHKVFPNSTIYNPVVSHVYDTPGTYSVNLSISGKERPVAFNFKSDYITVVEATPTPTPTPVPTFTVGVSSNYVQSSDSFFIPLWIWLFVIVFGSLLMIIGFYRSAVIISTLSFMCFMVAAYAAPSVGLFYREMVELDTGGYAMQPIVFQILQPWTMLLMYGFAVMALIVSFAGVLDWLDARRIEKQDEETYGIDAEEAEDFDTYEDLGKI